MADVLEEPGVAPSRMIFLPGHAGAPGPAANPRHRARWAAADLPALAAMAAQTIGEALGRQAAEAWRRRAGSIAALPPLRRVATDNRLQPWEWLRTADGRLLKTDGLDHHRAHDLIGAQDIAWDLAGGAVEFGLDAEARAAHAACVAEGGFRVSLQLTDWLTPAYLAFHIGAATFARLRCSGAETAAIDARCAALEAKLQAWLAG